MRNTNIRRAVVVSVLSLAMAACSDRGNDNGNGGPPPVVGPPPPATSIQSRIGASFAALFDAGNTTDARDPAPADLPPVSLTTEPIEG